MRTIITMPAYKAARTIERTYREIPIGCYDKVLVVDDASPDNTVEVAEGLGLETRRHTENRGYGGNQKTCYEWALSEGADIVVLLHPDYQYSPGCVPALIEPIASGRADFVFGSRFKDGGRPMDGGMPLYRYVGNRLTTGVENFVLRTRFSELHSGMKAYSRKFLQLVGYEDFSDAFVFDSQLLIRAVLLDFRIEELAIPTRYTDESSSVDIRSSIKYILETFGALGSALRDRKRVEREFEERSNALSS